MGDIPPKALFREGGVADCFFVVDETRMRQVVRLLKDHGARVTSKISRHTKFIVAEKDLISSEHEHVLDAAYVRDCVQRKRRLDPAGYYLKPPKRRRTAKAGAAPANEAVTLQSLLPELTPTKRGIIPDLEPGTKPTPSSGKYSQYRPEENRRMLWYFAKWGARFANSVVFWELANQCGVSRRSPASMRLHYQKVLSTPRFFGTMREISAAMSALAAGEPGEAKGAAPDAAPAAAAALASPAEAAPAEAAPGEAAPGEAAPAEAAPAEAAPAEAAPAEAAPAEAAPAEAAPAEAAPGEAAPAEAAPVPAAGAEPTRVKAAPAAAALSEEQAPAAAASDGAARDPASSGSNADAALFNEMAAVVHNLEDGGLPKLPPVSYALRGTPAEKVLAYVKAMAKEAGVALETGFYSVEACAGVWEAARYMLLAESLEFTKAQREALSKHMLNNVELEALARLFKEVTSGPDAQGAIDAGKETVARVGSLVLEYGDLVEDGVAEGDAPPAAKT